MEKYNSIFKTIYLPFFNVKITNKETYCFVVDQEKNFGREKVILSDYIVSLIDSPSRYSLVFILLLKF